MTTQSASYLTINDVEVDFNGLRLKVNDNWQNIEARQLALLKLLIEHQGQAVSRKQIMDELWQDTIVSDNSVSQLVTQLRKTLGDDKKSDDKSTATFIRTVPRIGYQLIATISQPILPIQNDKISNRQKLALIAATTIIVMLATLGLNYWLNDWLNGQTPNVEIERPVASRLTSMPGPENFLRFSPNGRYLAFNQNANNRQHTDLAVYDNQTQAIHSIKTTGYSEQTPEWSPDGRWLIYYRHDPISCSIRIMSVANPVETWRLSPDFRLADCAIGQTRHKMHWVSNDKLYLVSQSVNNQSVNKQSVNKQRKQNQHLSLLTLSTKGKPTVSNTQHFTNINPQHFDINHKQQLLYLEYQAPWHQLKQIDLNQFNQNRQQAKLIQQSNESLWTVKWHANDKDYWLGQHQGVSRFKGQKKQQTISLSHGFIADMDINSQGNQLAHSEGLMNVNLYALSLNPSLNGQNNNQSPQRISSAARTDLFPTLSPSGEQTLFISYKRFNDASNGQKDVWLKHIDKQAATLLTQLEQSINPKFILWSPNNDNVLIGDYAERLHLLNIFSKHLVTIVSDHQDLHSVYWSKDGQQINFTASKQQWQYQLASSTLNLMPKAPVEQSSFTTLNRSFKGYQQLLAEFLSDKLQHHIPTDNLHPSFAIYSPTVIDAGIYYVIRQGQQLKLYFYHFESQENSLITDIGFYQHAVNLPLHISASNDGKQLVYSLIEAIETDILLQPLQTK